MDTLAEFGAGDTFVYNNIVYICLDTDFFTLANNRLVLMAENGTVKTCSLPSTCLVRRCRIWIVPTFIATAEQSLESAAKHLTTIYCNGAARIVGIGSGMLYADDEGRLRTSVIKRKSLCRACHVKFEEAIIV